jgi:hypothetical protein
VTRRILPVLFILAFACFPASAQNPPQGFSPDILPDAIVPSSEFPLWVRDLRRGEIIAFGSFPFTMFASTFAMDASRYFDHDNDERYAPWPFKPPGAIEMSREDREKTLFAAAIASATIAVVDFAIIQIKRSREKQRIRQRENGGEIQITRSIIAEEADEESPEEIPEENP